MQIRISRFALPLRETGRLFMCLYVCICVLRNSEIMIIIMMIMIWKVAEVSFVYFLFDLCTHCYSYYYIIRFKLHQKSIPRDCCNNIGMFQCNHSLFFCFVDIIKEGLQYRDGKFHFKFWFNFFEYRIWFIVDK